jgi:hypothetical protein
MHLTSMLEGSTEAEIAAADHISKVVQFLFLSRSDLGLPIPFAFWKNQEKFNQRFYPAIGSPKSCSK